MEHDRLKMATLGHCPNNLKNQNFEKVKKIAGDIILPMCTINDNHMMYSSLNITPPPPSPHIPLPLFFLFEI